MGVALAIVLWVVFRSGGGGPGDAGKDAAAGGSSSGGGGITRRDVDRRPSSVAGRVTNAANGKPIPGAVVQFTRRGGIGAILTPGEPATPLSVTTDAEGEFEVASLLPGPYVVTASAAGFLTASKQAMLFRPAEKQVGLELALSAGGTTLSGTVTDIGGGPVAGAQIQAIRAGGAGALLFHRTPSVATTHPDGTYELQLTSGPYTVVVLHPDYVTAEETLVLEDKPRKLDVTLTPGGVVQGRVLVRDTLAPVANAVVRASGGEASTGEADIGSFLLSPDIALTDADGKFILRRVRASRIQIDVLAQGYSTTDPVFVNVGIAEVVDDVVVLVDKARSVSGTVVRKGTKTPMPGVLVGLNAIGRQNITIAPELSDEQGRFEIIGVQPGRYLVGAAGDGLVPVLIPLPLMVDQEDVTGLLVEVDTGSTLRGRVEPAGPARISLGSGDGGDPVGSLAAWLTSAEANDDGTFELKGVPAGQRTLLARSNDARGALTVEVAPGRDLDGLVIKLDARAHIAGKVVDDSGAPMGSVRVVVQDDQGGEVGQSAPTGADGTYEVKGLAPGTYGVSVTGETGTFAFAAGKGMPAEGPYLAEIGVGRGIDGLTLVVEGRGLIKGVVKADGKGVPDVWVTAKPAKGEPIRHDKHEPTALTDDAGRFVLRNVARGRYRLVADGKPGRGVKEPVSPGADVVIDLAELATISGKVTRNGSPVIAFEISTVGPTLDKKRFADKAGLFKISGLSGGAYEVIARDRLGAGRATVTLGDGDDATADITLAPLGSISGTVVDQTTEAPLEGFPIITITEDGDDESARGRPSVKTDAKGRFTVSGVGPGRGQIWVSSRAGGLNPVGGMESPEDLAPVAKRDFDLGPGQALDLGVIRAVPDTGERQGGELGVGMAIAVWGQRPGARRGDAPPEGVDPEQRLLWISALTAGGPGAQAGLRVGDQVRAIDATTVESAGAEVVKQSASAGRVRPGQDVVFKIDRGNGQEDVTVTAVAAPR